MSVIRKKRETMKIGFKMFFAAMATIAMGCFVLTACQPEPEPEPDFSEFDSLGYEIGDSIIVHFADERWATLNYTSYVEHEDLSGYDWINIIAHKEGSTYPFFKMKILKGEGVHAGHTSINDAGLGYTIPGAITGDPQCGSVFYYESSQVNSPDGTVTSDWWPLDISMSVLKYIDSTNQVTAYVTGTMFDYKSWVMREVENVEDAEVRDFTITFGDLPVNVH